MNANISEDMEADEYERSVDLINGVFDNPESSNTIEKLFPEFDFSGLHGIYKEHEGISKYLLLYDRVVVNLRPCDTDEEFERIYGVSIEGLKLLDKLGKVLIVVCYPYKEFGHLFSDLIKSRYPRSSRTRQYLTKKRSASKEDIYDRVKKIEAGQAYERYKRKAYSGLNLKAFYLSYASDLYDMHLLGLDDIVELIFDFSDRDPVFAHKLSIDYCDFLARPIFDCLGGVCAFSKNDRARASDYYIQTNALPIGTRKHLSVEAAHRIGAFTGVHPSELTGFFPDEISSLSFGHLDDPESFVTSIEQNRDVAEFRLRLHEASQGPVPMADMSGLASQICEKYERDASKAKWARDGIRLGLHIGSLLPTFPLIANPEQFVPLAKWALGVGVPAASNFGAARIDRLSQQIVQSIAGTLLKKPMLATGSSFHNRRINSDKSSNFS
jgi:hypothetical protein